MENASKALIIAGAILISIILISLGIMVMNSTGDVTGRMEEEMQGTSISAFNSKFTQYNGKQKGSTIKSLMNEMISSNASSDDHKVSVTGVLGTTASAVQAAAKSTTSYKVTISDSDDDGYVDTIDIQNS